MRDFQEKLSRAKAGETNAMNEISKFANSHLLTLQLINPFPSIAVRASNSDIVQMSLLKFFQKLETFRGTTESEFRVWLSRIAQHTLVDVVRRAKSVGRCVDREVPLEPVAADQTTLSAAMRRSELNARAKRALTQLPDFQQLAIRLKYEDQLPIDEIARRLGRTEVAVAGLLRRGIKRLRELMSKTTKVSLHQ